MTGDHAMALKRPALIAALTSAGSNGDDRAFLRLYTENRISLDVSKAAFARGKKIAKSLQVRETCKETGVEAATLGGAA